MLRGGRNVFRGEKKKTGRLIENVCKTNCEIVINALKIYNFSIYFYIILTLYILYCIVKDRKQRDQNEKELIPCM